MRSAILSACVLLGLPISFVCCLQAAGVEQVTFTSDAGRDGEPIDAPLRTDSGAAADAGSDGDAAPLPAEDCPTCGGATCCSPKHCMSGVCCASRDESCATTADCCSGSCDLQAGRCTGPCVAPGGSPCVTPSDCCSGTCNSAGQCKQCQQIDGGCTSDIDCCFGLGCTSSEGGVCARF